MVPLIPAMAGTILVALACFAFGWVAARAAYSTDVRTVAVTTRRSPARLPVEGTEAR